MAYTNFYPKTGVSGNAGTSGKPGYSGDIGIDYIDYLAEKLNDSVKYTEHISNSINNSVNYSDFLSLNGIQMKDPIKTCKVIPNADPLLYSDAFKLGTIITKDAEGGTHKRRGHNRITKLREKKARVERMRITNQGNVGIATTTPYYKLDVAGDIRVRGSNKIRWGGTTTDDDCNLYRYTASTLKTDGSFTTGGTLGINEQPKNENIGWWCEKNKTSDDFWKYKL